MAENNTNASQDLTVEGSTTIMSNSRRDLAVEAAENIDTLCGVLTLQTVNDCEVAALLARVLSARMAELSRIIMRALCDPAEKTGELAYELRLKREAA